LNLFGRRDTEFVHENLHQTRIKQFKQRQTETNGSKLSLMQVSENTQKAFV
jgi:hypothetical protein